MKKSICLLAMLVLFAISACASPVNDSINRQPDFLTVIDWNLQTFFDAQTDGCEYSQFMGTKSTWSEAKYRERLKRLCAFIEETQADIYVFQEIENASILQDIANELVGLRAIEKGYGYSCFSKNEEESLGIAVLSKYPLKNISVHQIDLQTSLGLSRYDSSNEPGDGENLVQPSMRAILRLELDLNSEKAITIYACHWKSKYGGASQSEIWRNAQERLLADLLANEKNVFLVAGDFNRSLDEFIGSNSLVEEGFVFLDGTESPVAVISPWIRFEDFLQMKGSYYYQNKWEKIDHFFYSCDLSIVDFQVLANDAIITESGSPFRYDLYTGKGVSDHLPLQCIIEL